MKTPRELLLQKHRAANPALDDVRHKALETVQQLAVREQRPDYAQKFTQVLTEFSKKLWAELILPNRKTWATLASIWLVILGFSIASSVDSTQPNLAKAEPLSKETLIALRHQRQELAKLIDSKEPEPAEAPRRGLPPQSVIQPKWMVG